MSLEFEKKVREAAFLWLNEVTDYGTESISTSEINSFYFENSTFRLMNPQGGIWKPKSFKAALSIRTGFSAPNKPPKYEDSIGKDGLLYYKYMEGGPDVWGNVALRMAFKTGLPLIWFYAIKTGTYLPIYPVFIIKDEPENSQVVVAISDTRSSSFYEQFPEQPIKLYSDQLVKIRLHQPVFRERVILAYKKRCAMCGLNHTELLDAAHIIPDSLEDGLAIVPNGLSLCKIHHAAFDKNIIGIKPNLEISIRADILDEKDGPMLRHGIQS